jgi:Na+/H+-dicarboxylate symporter
MITKKIFKGIQSLHILKAVPVIFFVLIANIAVAQSQTTSPGDKPPDAFPYFEVFGSIAMIIVLIVVAWFFGAKQTQNTDAHFHASDGDYHPHMPRRHFDHPNDPHFRKIKRKTS